MPDAPRLAVQLYTLRDFCKTEDDLRATCRRLADTGWTAVQVSAIGVDDPKVVRQILDDSGLACCATHVRPPERLWDDTDALAEELATLGTTYTAVGGFFPRGDDFSRETWSAWVTKFNRGAKALAARGCSAGYHNHSHEWAKLGGKDDVASERAIDLLVRDLASEAWFELDVYWVAHAGGSPGAWLRKLAGRVPVIHLKDLAIDRDSKQYMAEVGVGNLDWDDVLSAASEAGAAWWAVEQDVCYRDPFASLETSLTFLHARGLR